MGRSIKSQPFVEPVNYGCSHCINDYKLYTGIGLLKVTIYMKVKSYMYLEKKNIEMTIHSVKLSLLRINLNIVN